MLAPVESVLSPGAQELLHDCLPGLEAAAVRFIRLWDGEVAEHLRKRGGC